jgi:hypothetical protein
MSSVRTDCDPKMYLEILTGLHVFRAPEYEEVLFVCRLCVCICRWMDDRRIDGHVHTHARTLLAPKRRDRFYSYSVF